MNIYTCNEYLDHYMDLPPFSGLRLISLLPYLPLFLFGMLTRWCMITWKSPLVFIFHKLHWFSTDLSSKYINEFKNQGFESGLKLW